MNRVSRLAKMLDDREGVVTPDLGLMRKGIHPSFV